MYLRVPLYKYKFCSTYGYFCTSISIRINSITPTGDLNKHKSAIRISRHISLLHEFMINSDICYCTSILLNASCNRILMHLYMYKSYISH